MDREYPHLEASAIDDAPPPPRRTYGDLLREVALLLPNIARLFGGLLRDPRVPRRQKVMLAMAAAYIASPIDVIPDFVPAVGHLDDVVVAAIAVDQLMRSVPSDVLFEHWRGSVDSLDLVRSIVEWGVEIIPGVFSGRAR